MTKTYKSFETDRLLLIPTAVEDAAFQLQLMNSPLWIQNIGDRGVKTLESCEEYILNRMIAQKERLGFSNYTVFLKPEKIPIGSCGLYDREGMEGIDIGFAFMPEYFGQGYAYEAASTIMQAGIELYGLSKIIAITIRNNTASQKLLDKLGLKYIKDIRLPNDDAELLYYEYNVTK